MIYLDTSVALAHLLSETRVPPPDFWNEALVTSRLFQYEIWTRLRAFKAEERAGAAATELVERLIMFELAPEVLARALEPFPVPVSTLDALHLATLEYIRGQGRQIALASYDHRMLEAARALRIPLAPCG